MAIIPFPPLPNPPADPWPFEVLDAYQNVYAAFNHASTLVSQENTDDVLQLESASQRLEEQVFLLDALEQGGLPEDWIVQAASSLVSVIEALDSMAAGASQW